jgi:HSP20 family molecular chaperone IbpA
MSETKEVTTNKSGDVQTTKQPEVFLRPLVDVYENKTGLILQADLPGVSNEHLNIHVDKDTLLIEGEASISMPENMEAFYADVRATHYRRSFSLSPELETEKIDASMKDGVLSLHIPKREQFKPRKIEVRTV